MEKLEAYFLKREGQGRRKDRMHRRYREGKRNRRALEGGEKGVEVRNLQKNIVLVRMRLHIKGICKGEQCVV